MGTCLKMKIFSIVLLASVMAAASAAKWDKPWFCHDLECPEYSVDYKNATTGVEVRTYQPAVWVTTNITGIDYQSSVSKGFMSNFAYISGSNSAGQKIEMTSPVMVKIIPGQGPNCNSTFQISFFMPAAQRDNPPMPTAENSFIQHTPTFKVAVIQYGGFANKWSTVQPKAQQLAEDLQAAGTEFDPTVMTAGYDPPFRVINRHNEVWYALM